MAWVLSAAWSRCLKSRVALELKRTEPTVTPERRPTPAPITAPNTIVELSTLVVTMYVGIQREDSNRDAICAILTVETMDYIFYRSAELSHQRYSLSHQSTLAVTSRPKASFVL